MIVSFRTGLPVPPPPPTSCAVSLPRFVDPRVIELARLASWRPLAERVRMLRVRGGRKGARHDG